MKSRGYEFGMEEEQLSSGVLYKHVLSNNLLWVQLRSIPYL